MSYNISRYTKILTLTIASYLFILVGALSVCQFAMVPGVYILLCPKEEEVATLFFLRTQIYTFSSTIIKKI